MIEFIEKEPRTYNDPFIEATYIPVCMVKDGLEYFVMNRDAKYVGDSLWAQQGNSDLDRAKKMLVENDGQYFMFRGQYPNPADMLTEIERRKHTFAQPDELFAECFEEGYCCGFVDFGGNLNEVSASFMYRIFDKNLAEYLKQRVQQIMEMSKKRMKEKYRDVCESLDWSVHVCDDGMVELEKYSPAGEDFCFAAAIDDFVQEVKEYAAGFDIDEHIAMWIEAKQNGTRGVPSARELVHDAEDIDKMLQELAAALAAAEEDEND